MGGMKEQTFTSSSNEKPKVYQDLQKQQKIADNHNNDEDEIKLINETKWYVFDYSDVYKSLEEEYERLSSGGGDINLLALFLADHPFHARSLLQLSTVLYKTGNAEKGKELLQRCLQVYECAAYHTLFYPNKNNNS